jgi:hypothetical protein
MFELVVKLTKLWCHRDFVKASKCNFAKIVVAHCDSDNATANPNMPLVMKLNSF